MKTQSEFRSLRVSEGWTQGATVAMLGVTWCTIIDWETGLYDVPTMAMELLRRDGSPRRNGCFGEQV